MAGKLHALWLAALMASTALAAHAQKPLAPPTLPLSNEEIACKQGGAMKGCTPAQIAARVSSNAQLSAMPSTYGKVVRDGFAGPGDAPSVLYTATGGACTLGAGAGDGGSQAPTSDGKCWVLAPQVQYDVRLWGAKCDGTTNDSPAISKAASAMGPTKGGILFIPATGAACVLNTGVQLQNNTTLMGVGQTSWPGPDGTVAQWTASGSWLLCKDLVNPCITTSTGVILRDFNVIYNQPTPPTTGTWTPTIYPYTILISNFTNFVGLQDLGIVAATHCVDWEGPSTGVGGIYSYMRDIWFNGCFVRGTLFHQVDNTIHLSNLRYDPWWYADRAPMVAYIEANKVDWDVQYLANAQGEGIEFYESLAPMKFTDATVNSGFGNVTFAANDLQLSNVSFNETCQGMIVASSTTHVTGSISNVLAYGDTATNCPVNFQYFFNLASDNADWRFINLRGGFLGSVARIGGGTSGVLHIAFPSVQKYSAFAAGKEAFSVANGAVLDMPNGTDYILPASGAGAMIAGANLAPFRVGVSNGAGSFGSVALAGGSATATGSIQFFSPAGARQGYIGQGVNGNLALSPDGSGQIQLNGNLYAPGMVTSCSGQPTGTLRNNAGVVNVCP